MIRKDRTSLYLLFIVAALFFCSGCIPIILPTPEYITSGSGLRPKIEEKALEFIVPGSTRKEEVLLKLGEPDRVWRNEKNFLYWWATNVGVWGVVSELGSVGGSLRRYLYLLFVEFDEKDVVKRRELKVRSLSGAMKTSFIDFYPLIVEEISLWDKPAIIGPEKAETVRDMEPAGKRQTIDRNRHIPYPPYTYDDLPKN